MSNNKISIIDQIQTYIDFDKIIFTKAHTNFVEDQSIFNAMIAVISFHVLCEWVVADGKTTWQNLRDNCNEINIIASLSNHFKHKEESKNTGKLNKTVSTDPGLTPEGDYELGSFVIYSELKTKHGLNDGNNDLEFLLEDAYNFISDIMYGNTPFNNNFWPST